MELSYRGIRYQSNPSLIPTLSGEIISKYRGVTLRSKHYTIPLSPQPSVDMKYRGTSYQGVTYNSINLVNTVIKANA